MEKDKELQISHKKHKCVDCLYYTNSKKDYDKHLNTVKHKRKENGSNISKIPNKNPKIINHKCMCGKIYPYAASLWKHKKKCVHKENNDNNNNNNNEKSDDKIINSSENTELKELIMKLLLDNADMKKENQKLMSQIVEIVPNVGNNNNSNNINNIKNKFNINVFLNEKCKDALSMDQFIDKIEVSMKNLLLTGNKGLGSGLSNIIMDNMNKLSLYERPMHCTDKKRETLYVKNHEWQKDETKDEINKLIKRVEKKQINNIEKWTDENPKFMESEKLQDDYMKIVKGCTSSIDDCRDKVIKNVCDKLYIEKE